MTCPTKIEILADQILQKLPGLFTCCYRLLLRLFVLWPVVLGRRNFVNLGRPLCLAIVPEGLVVVCLDHSRAGQLFHLHLGARSSVPSSFIVRFLVLPRCFLPLRDSRGCLCVHCWWPWKVAFPLLHCFQDTNCEWKSREALRFASTEFPLVLQLKCRNPPED